MLNPHIILNIFSTVKVLGLGVRNYINCTSVKQSQESQDKERSRLPYKLIHHAAEWGSNCGGHTG